MLRFILAACAAIFLAPLASAQTAPGTYTLTAGTTIQTVAPLPSLKANSSDRFVLADGTTIKLRTPDDKPLTRLRDLGVSGALHYYGSASDTTAILPPSDPFAGVVAKAVSGAKNSVGLKLATNMKVSRAWISGAYRAYGGPNNSAYADDITLDTVRATDVTRDGISLCNARRLTIRNFYLTHAAAPSTGDDLPEGIALGRSGCGETGSNVTIASGYVSGFKSQTADGTYHNGDGVAVEGGYDTVYIGSVTSENNTDGCFDVKASHLTLDNLVARNCNRTYRIWSPSAEATTLTAEGFNGAALWAGQGASIHIAKFIARGGNKGAPVFRWESGVTIIVDECDLTGLSPGVVLTKSDGTSKQIKLGAGCKLP
jgi:hypothetical protein